MKLFIIALLLMFSPTPQEEKQPPIDLGKEKVVQNFKAEPILLVKISGDLKDTEAVRNIITKMGAEHRVDTLLLYSDELMPVLMPRKEFEKHKDNENYINAEKFIEKMKEQLKKEAQKDKPQDKET